MNISEFLYGFGDDLMAEKQESRRTRRTRKLIEDALMSLMLEKRYDKITVQDIIDRADVGRSTFYAHFDGKEDFLTSDFEHLFASLSQQMDIDQGKKNEDFSTVELFKHIQVHHGLYKALVWGRGVELIFKQGNIILSRIFERRLIGLVDDGEESKVPFPVLANHLAGSFLTLLKWWLDNNMPHTPEEMNDMYQHMVLPGVWASLGRDG